MELTRIVVAVAFAGVCVGSAMPTLAGAAAMRQAAEHFGIPWPRYRLIGVLLAAAAVGIIGGIYWPVAGYLAASGMVLLLLGAVYFHRRAHDPFVKLLPAVITIAIAIAYLAVVSSWGDHAGSGASHGMSADCQWVIFSS